MAPIGPYSVPALSNERSLDKVASILVGVKRHFRTAPGRTWVALKRDDRELGDDRAPQTREKKRRIRRSREQRQEEIARATYKLLGERGLTAVTVSQIAKEVGMSTPALYAHFSSREEMLVAAMEPVYERVSEWLSISTKPNARERLREMGRKHSEFMASELGFVIPVFEFALAPRETDLAFRFGKRQLEVIKKIADTVAEGQRQGSVRADLNPMRAAWSIMIFAWSEDIARLMGLEEYITEGYSRELLDVIINDIAPRDDGCKDMGDQS
jgi:AcrR family transcriptional regulator